MLLHQHTSMRDFVVQLTQFCETLSINRYEMHVLSLALSHVLCSFLTGRSLLEALLLCGHDPGKVGQCFLDKVSPDSLGTRLTTRNLMCPFVSTHTQSYWLAINTLETLFIQIDCWFVSCPCIPLCTQRHKNGWFFAAGRRVQDLHSVLHKLSQVSTSVY